MSSHKCENGTVRRTFRMVSAGFIWAGLSLLYYFVWLSWYAQLIPTPFFRRGHWVVGTIYAVLLFLFTKMYGGYRIGDIRIFELIYSHTLALTIVNVITWLQVSMLAYKLVSAVPLVIMAVAQIILVTIWAVVCNRLYFNWFPPRKMLLIFGNDTLDAQLLHKLHLRPDKYNIQRIISVDEGLTAIFELIPQYSSVMLCDVQSPQRNDILKFCYEHSVRTYVTPKISDIILRGSEAIQLFDTPLLVSKNRGLSFEQRVAKRILDSLLMVVALPVLLPVFALVAVAIKLEDGGPVFYKQKRLTEGGKEFFVWKFRSMVVDAERDGIARLAAERDERITRVGRIIRALRVDELPQFLNILRGEMSIVGPRPERPEIFEQYTQEMPEFQYRLNTKAGLTGYAQVYGRYNTTPYDKLKLDLMYIQNYSLLLDLKIIMTTVKVLFMKESTEGIPADQVTATTSGSDSKK